MQLLMDMHVGKAIPAESQQVNSRLGKLVKSYEPFLRSFSFLNTLLVSSKICLSPHSQISLTDAPTTHLSTNCFKIPETKDKTLKKCDDQAQKTESYVKGRQVKGML